MKFSEKKFYDLNFCWFKVWRSRDTGPYFPWSFWKHSERARLMESKDETGITWVLVALRTCFYGQTTFMYMYTHKCTSGFSFFSASQIAIVYCLTVTAFGAIFLSVVVQGHQRHGEPSQTRRHCLCRVHLWRRVRKHINPNLRTLLVYVICRACSVLTLVFVVWLTAGGSTLIYWRTLTCLASLSRRAITS